MAKLIKDIYLLCIQFFLLFLLGSERLALYMFKASLNKIRYKALICVQTRKSYVGVKIMELLLTGNNLPPGPIIVMS